MLVEERRQKVLDLVKDRGFVALADLAGTLAFSESTLRRDLDYLDQQGRLKRTHGGAVYIGEGQSLPAFEDRTAAAAAQKRWIAERAAARVNDGDSILLDGGTTTLEVARRLLGRPLQIVTNSLPIGSLFANRREVDLVFLGGYVFPRTGVALGPLTIRMMAEIHVQQAILSVGGITAKGLFNNNVLLVETERQMMACADEVVVVADHSKIGRQALAYLCGWNEIDTLIVDAGLSKEQRRMIEETGTRLIVTGGEPEEAYA